MRSKYTGPRLPWYEKKRMVMAAEIHTDEFGLN